MSTDVPGLVEFPDYPPPPVPSDEQHRLDFKLTGRPGPRNDFKLTLASSKRNTLANQNIFVEEHSFDSSDVHINANDSNVISNNKNENTGISDVTIATYNASDTFSVVVKNLGEDIHSPRKKASICGDAINPTVNVPGSGRKSSLVTEKSPAPSIRASDVELRDNTSHRQASLDESMEVLLCRSPPLSTSRQDSGIIPSGVASDDSIVNAGNDERSSEHGCGTLSDQDWQGTATGGWMMADNWHIDGTQSADEADCLLSLPPIYLPSAVTVPPVPMSSDSEGYDSGRRARSCDMDSYSASPSIVEVSLGLTEFKNFGNAGRFVVDKDVNGKEEEMTRNVVSAVSGFVDVTLKPTNNMPIVLSDGETSRSTRSTVSNLKFSSDVQEYEYCGSPRGSVLSDHEQSVHSDTVDACLTNVLREKRGMTPRGADVFPARVGRNLARHTFSTFIISDGDVDSSADEPIQKKKSNTIERCENYPDFSLLAVPAATTRRIEKSSSEDSVMPPAVHRRRVEPPSYEEALLHKALRDPTLTDAQRRFKKSVLAKILYEKSLRQYQDESTALLREDDVSGSPGLATPSSISVVHGEAAYIGGNDFTSTVDALRVEEPSSARSEHLLDDVTKLIPGGRRSIFELAASSGDCPSSFKIESSAGSTNFVPEKLLRLPPSYDQAVSSRSIDLAFPLLVASSCSSPIVITGASSSHPTVLKDSNTNAFSKKEVIVHPDIEFSPLLCKLTSQHIDMIPTANNSSERLFFLKPPPVHVLSSDSGRSNGEDSPSLSVEGNARRRVFRKRSSKGRVRTRFSDPRLSAAALRGEEPSTSSAALGRSKSDSSELLRRIVRKKPAHPNSGFDSNKENEQKPNSIGVVDNSESNQSSNLASDNMAPPLPVRGFLPSSRSWISNKLSADTDSSDFDRTSHETVVRKDASSAVARVPGIDRRQSLTVTVKNKEWHKELTKQYSHPGGHSDAESIAQKGGHSTTSSTATRFLPITQFVQLQERSAVVLSKSSSTRAVSLDKNSGGGSSGGGERRPGVWRPTLSPSKSSSCLLQGGGRIKHNSVSRYASSVGRDLTGARTDESIGAKASRSFPLEGIDNVNWSVAKLRANYDEDEKSSKRTKLRILADKPSLAMFSGGSAGLCRGAVSEVEEGCIGGD